MKKEFSMSNDKVIINFTAKYCSTFEGVLESEGFRRGLHSYLRRKQNKIERDWDTGVRSLFW